MLDKGSDHRRYFIGGSDARIIMGTDEASLIRLWREKRGEMEPEDFSGNLIVQLGVVTEDLNRRWYEANTGQASLISRRDPSSGPALDGGDPRWPGRASGAVFEAKFMLPWSFRRKRRPRSICRSCSTICGSWRRGAACSRSSPAAANGWRSRPMPIHFTNT